MSALPVRDLFVFFQKQPYLLCKHNLSVSRARNKLLDTLLSLLDIEFYFFQESQEKEVDSEADNEKESDNETEKEDTAIEKDDEKENNKEKEESEEMETDE